MEPRLQKEALRPLEYLGSLLWPFQPEWHASSRPAYERQRDRVDASWIPHGS